MTKWGEIMPVKRRLELLKYADERHHLVIEDDFENEFVYFQKPTPSLFGLSGGQGVVYIGSFSRLLLPSIRISFMILPPELLNAYKKKAGFYNQTASKAEQIALCQFIRGRSSCCTDQKAETTLFFQIKTASQLSPSGIWQWLSDSGGRSRYQSGSYFAL